MSNINDFWGSAKERLRPKRKISIRPRIDYKNKVLPLFRSFSVGSRLFIARIYRLPFVLSRRDKLVIAIFLTVLLGLIGYRYYREYLIKTEIVPTIGGTYEEILIGEANYLNPILAKGDTERVINSLIYSGLTKIDKSGIIVPDLALSWAIADEDKTYIFHLRDDVSWHDGMRFTANDIVYTIEEIRNQNIKSPYFQAWKDVQVETPDDFTVIFRLDNPYGPFIYNTLVGIIPAHVESSIISSSPIGTGPYKFSKVISDKNKKIQEVMLARNDNYWLEKYYLKNIKFHIVSDDQSAEKKFKSKNISAVANLRIEKEGVKNYSFSTPRHFGLLFNLTSEKFKDEALRKKFKSEENFDPKFKFTLTILDRPLCISQAEKIKSELVNRGIDIKIDKRSPIEFQTIIEKRQFETMLYGFDLGYDRDSYPFWHSSEISAGMNYSGFSEKGADILLEDARMTTDPAARNQKYDEFMNILHEKVPVIFYPNQDFIFSIKDTIKGVEKITGIEPWDHLNSIDSWYIKTKRAKP
jgi:peptide/nickel transport system substrate-binding protein